MAFRAATCSLLLGLTALIPAASGCGARSDLGGTEASFRCEDGSRAGAVGCDRITFAAPVSYPVSSGGSQVVIADLNGDGALDLAVAGWYADTVTVLLNHGDGTFSDGVHHATSSEGGVTSFAAGDLNQDGAVDLVFIPATDQGTSVSVLLNDGHGAFAPGVLYVAGHNLSEVALGDLDGDGLLDIATANVWDDAVAILSNRGDGTFAPPVTLGPVALPTGLLAADLNGDGRLDLAVTSSGLPAGGVSFFMNAGGGAFVGPFSNPEIGPYGVIGDVNGDRRPDYLYSAGSGDVGVRLNAGDGTFGAEVSFPVAHARTPFSTAIADLNGDCRPDLASVGEDNVVMVLRNLGDGTFGPPDAHVVEPGAYWVAAGDLDGDGKVDLAVAYVGFDLVTVLLNRGCDP